MGRAAPSAYKHMENFNMKRFVPFAVLAFAAVAPLAAQSPAGWKLRVDRSTTASDPDGAGDIKFVKAGTGFHATNPQAAVYWNPANTATGNYTLKATFSQLAKSGHTNYFGLVFGGSGLDGDAQAYIYFTVAQDGSWLVKRRDGNVASTVAPKTVAESVKKIDEAGKSTNTLEVRVSADKIDFVVNGTVVNTQKKEGPLAKTDGIYGIRVNHLLDVQIDGLTVTK